MENDIRIKGEMEKYYVSTKDTFDHGLETMVFKYKNNGDIDWSEVYAARYKTMDEAIKGHEFICSHLEEILENERLKER